MPKIYARARIEPNWKKLLCAASSAVCASQSEFALQDVVDCLRTRLAAGCFHHLADKPSNRFWICLGVGHLVRVLRDDFVYDLLDCTDVGHLLHAPLLDDGPRVATFSPDNLE